MDCSKCKEERENARIGYQAALSYAGNEKQLVWIRTSGIMVANAIFIAIIGSLFTTAAKGEANVKLMSCMVFVFSFCGLLTCSLWMLVTERTKKLSDLYVWSARRLEEEYLTPVNTLELGGRLGQPADDKKKCKKREYGQVTITTNTEVKTIQIKGLLCIVGQFFSCTIN